jgi:hypothetical protein
VHLAGIIGLSVAFLLVAPLLALTFATLLNLVVGLMGLRLPELLTYGLAWAVVISVGWRLFSQAREARTRESAFRAVGRPLALLWLVGCGFLSVLFATFASDSGTPEAMAASSWVLGVGLLLAVAPLLILEAARVLYRRKPRG